MKHLLWICVHDVILYYGRADLQWKKERRWIHFDTYCNALYAKQRSMHTMLSIGKWCRAHQMRCHNFQRDPNMEINATEDYLAIDCTALHFVVQPLCFYTFFLHFSFWFCSFFFIHLFSLFGFNCASLQLCNNSYEAQRRRRRRRKNNETGANYNKFQSICWTDSVRILCTSIM